MNVSAGNRLPRPSGGAGPRTELEEDTLAVPKLDRLARFVPDACTTEKLHSTQPKLSVRQQ